MLIKRTLNLIKTLLFFFKKRVEALNAYKKNINPHQNFTGFYKKDVEVQYELQNPLNKGQNQKLKM